MARTSIATLSNYCFLMNGRQHDYSATSSYSCGYNSPKIGEHAGKPIFFEGIDIYTTTPRVNVRFNGKWIILNGELTDFFDKDSKRNAKSIFGKDVSASVVAEMSSIAMRSLLRAYRDQINDAINGVNQ